MAFSKMKVKPDPFSSYGYNGKTIYDDNRSTTTTLNLINQLTFNGLGKVNKMREKYELIMGSPLILTKTQLITNVEYQIHPFFEYLMKKWMSYDTISLQKFTEYNPRGLHQFVKADDDQKAGASEKIKQIVNILIKDLNDKRQYLGLEKKNRLERLQWYHQEINKLKQQCWASYNKLVENGFTQPCLKGFKFQRRQTSVMSQQEKMVVKKLFQQVNALQPLRENFQTTKIKIFEKKHKSYYLATLVNKIEVKEKQDTYTYLNKMRIKKLSNSPELLQNLEELVRLREQDDNTNTFSTHIMKQVCIQLKSYMNEVSNENVKFFYQYLSPTSVLFDQQSLRPKLSYEPMMLDALGLKKRPQTIQNSIAFFPTAQTFDYFQSLPQLQQNEKLILDDPFYGTIQMFGEQKNRLTPDQKVTIYGYERRRLQELKQMILVWRFMLTGYYFTRGIAFGAQTNEKPIKCKQKDFEQILKLKAEQLKNDKTKVGQFMFGIFKTKYEQQSKQFNFTFDELYHYLGLRDSRDQLIESLKYKRIKKYHNMRKSLLRQILKVFMAENLFARLHNVKKYLIMYSVIANQVLEETKEMVEAEEKKFGERKNLKESFDKDIRRLSNQKSYKQTLKYTFQKIQKYKNRPTDDAQSKYVNKDEEGSAIFKSIQKLKNFLIDLGNEQDQLNKRESVIKPEDQIYSQQERKINEDNKKKYIESFKSTYKAFNQQLEQFKNTCFKTFKTCFRTKLPENLHKYDKDIPNAKESHQLYTTEFQLIVKALFYLKISNITEYQSLVMANLHMDDTDRRVEVQILTRKELEKKAQRLKLVEQFFKDQYQLQSLPYSDEEFTYWSYQSSPNSYEDQENSEKKNENKLQFQKQNRFRKEKKKIDQRLF